MARVARLSRAFLVVTPGIIAGFSLYGLIQASRQRLEDDSVPYARELQAASTKAEHERSSTRRGWAAPISRL